MRRAIISMHLFSCNRTWWHDLSSHHIWCICRLSSVHSSKEWTFEGRVSIYHIHVCVSFVNIHDIIWFIITFPFEYYCTYFSILHSIVEISNMFYCFFGHQGRPLCSLDFHGPTSGESLGNVIERCACEHLSGGGVGWGYELCPKSNKQCQTANGYIGKKLFLEFQMSQCHETACNINCGKLLM